MRRLDYTEINDEKEVSKFVCLTFILLILGNALNITSIVLGAVHNNATCYEDKYALSLSDWLLLENSIAIFAWIIYLTFIAITCLGCYRLMIIWLIIIVLLYVYYVVMTVFGIIELIAQFTTCKTEVPSICILVIINIILQLAFTIQKIF